MIFFASSARTGFPACVTSSGREHQILFPQKDKNMRMQVGYVKYFYYHNRIVPSTAIVELFVLDFFTIVEPLIFSKIAIQSPRGYSGNAKAERVIMRLLQNRSVFLCQLQMIKIN